MSEGNLFEAEDVQGLENVLTDTTIPAVTRRNLLSKAALGTSAVGAFGALRLAATFPVHERTALGVPVLFFDPKTGQLVQRLNLPGAGPQAMAGRSQRLLPTAEFGAPPVVVRVSGGGLVYAPEAARGGVSAALLPVDPC